MLILIVISDIMTEEPFRFKREKWSTTIVAAMLGINARKDEN